MKTSNMILLFTSGLSVFLHFILDNSYGLEHLHQLFRSMNLVVVDAEYRVVQSCLNLPINNAPIFGDLL